MCGPCRPAPPQRQQTPQKAQDSWASRLGSSCSLWETAGPAVPGRGSTTAGCGSPELAEMQGWESGQPDPNPELGAEARPPVALRPVNGW